MRGLADKVAVVTGAGSGIGRACAVRLAEEGARVAAVDVVGERAEETAHAIVETGGRAVALACDVTDAERVRATWAQARDELGGFDILVNSVAWAVRKSLAEIELDEWYRTVDGCLNSYFLCIKFALPHFSAAGAGKIVNICSISAHVGYGIPAYSAAKGGILALTRQLAGEFAAQKININSVSPGVIETGANRDTLGDAAIRQRTIDLTPWGRLGRPEDIAAPVAFLASADADFITGADLVVDGAMSSTVAWGAVGDQFRSFHADAKH